MSPPPKRARTIPVRTIMTRSTTLVRPATTINDLFDDVLRESFGHMSASDLIVMADVCNKFRRNAQAEFASRYKKVFFGYNPGDNHRFRVDFHLRQLAPALRNFGQSIVAIGINTVACRSESWHVMDSIIKYCGESLKELRLYGIVFTPGMVRKLKPILLRLDSLTLITCSWTPAPLAARMLSLCRKLRWLTIRNVDVSDQAIQHFLASNPPLENIDINGCKQVKTSQTIESIVKHAPRIESITLCIISKDSSGFIESAKKLKRLTALEVLRIECMGQSFSPVLRELAAACIPLKDLLLYSFLWDDEFTNEVIKLKQLERLRLPYFGNVSSADVLTIVRNMIDLTELDLLFLDPLPVTDLVEVVQSAPKLRKFKILSVKCVNFTFDVDVFMQIRNIVANRKSPGLLLVIDHVVKVDVPKNVLKENEGYLKIENSEEFQE